MQQPSEKFAFSQNEAADEGKFGEKNFRLYFYDDPQNGRRGGIKFYRPISWFIYFFSFGRVGTFLPPMNLLLLRFSSGHHTTSQMKGLAKLKINAIEYRNGRPFVMNMLTQVTGAAQLQRFSIIFVLVNISNLVIAPFAAARSWNQSGQTAQPYRHLLICLFWHSVATEWIAALPFRRKKMEIHFRELSIGQRTLQFNFFVICNVRCTWCTGATPDRWNYLNFYPIIAQRQFSGEATGPTGLRRTCSFLSLVWHVWIDGRTKS